MASSSSSQSYFTRTVTLQDWWLVKTDSDGNGDPKTSLGVSGTTSYPNQAVRVFLSAPIAERLGDFTVETSDGVCLVLQSFINTQRTIDNGFSSQVAKSFSIGFPKDWQLYAQKYSHGEESTTERENPARDSNSSPDIPPSVTIQTKSKLNQSLKSPTHSKARASVNTGVNPEAARPIHDEVRDSPLGLTIQTKSKVNQLEKSPTHSKARASVNTGANPEAAMPIHDEVRNSPLGLTIQTKSKVNQLEKSPTHSKARASVNIGANPEAATPIHDEVRNSPQGLTIQMKSKVNQLEKSPTHSNARAFVNTSANPEAARTMHGEIPNSSPGLTIQTRSKVSESVKTKSHTHSKARAFVNKSAGTGSGMKEKRMGACQSKTGDKNQNISNHVSGLRVGSFPYQSTEELQERPSDPKRGNKFQNLRHKAAAGADTKEKRATEKKAKLKRKLFDAKEPKTPEKNTKRKIKFDEQATTPRPQQDNVAKCIVSPESLSVGRSRSGRILLPVLEFWRNQIPVYDLDRKVTGILNQTVPVPERGGDRSESRKKRKL